MDSTFRVPPLSLTEMNLRADFGQSIAEELRWEGPER